MEKGEGTLESYAFGKKTLENEVDREYSVDIMSGSVRL